MGVCGIWGAYNLNIEDDIVKKCLDSLAHRGPDGEGIYRNNAVVFGHRRLSILDLSSRGKQPMVSEDGNFIISFNGEIYNFLEIRKELISLGHTFKSDTDSEVVLHAYMEWKEKCVERFNGMWAFAIWDNTIQKMFLCRDRFGIKPLFYYEEKGGYCFASEMKAIAPIMNRVNPNMKLIKNINRILTYEATDECLILGIKRMPAGHYAWIDKTGIQLVQWWKTIDHIVELPQSYDEQVAMFRELFLDACKIRMRSDVTIGTALSGGLDSSSTISAMSYIARNLHGERVNNDWQHAYVATFPGTSQDESYYAKQVTDYLGIESTFLEIDPVKGWENIEKYVYLFEDFHLTSPVPMMMLYGELRNNNTLVSIDGHGADELLGGYAFDILYAYGDACSEEERGEIANICAGMNNNGVENNKWLTNGAYINFSARRALSRILHPIEEKNRNQYLNELGSLNARLYDETHKEILPTLLRNYDRYSMANGVEIRMPFMDYRIVQMAFSLDWKSKLRNGYSKAIVRDALATYMPNEIAYRKSKIGFNTPINDWIKGGLKEYFEDTLNSIEFCNSNMVNPLKCKKRFQRIIRTEQPSYAWGQDFWIHFYPYLWEKAFFKKVDCI